MMSERFSSARCVIRLLFCLPGDTVAAAVVVVVVALYADCLTFCDRLQRRCALHAYVILWPCVCVQNTLICVCVCACVGINLLRIGTYTHDHNAKCLTLSDGI